MSFYNVLRDKSSHIDTHCAAFNMHAMAKDATLHLRLSKALKEQIEKAALAEERSVSSYVERLLRGCFEPGKIRLEPVHGGRIGTTP